MCTLLVSTINFFCKNFGDGVIIQVYTGSKLTVFSIGLIFLLFQKILIFKDLQRAV